MAHFLTRTANGFRILGISFKLFFRRPSYLVFPFINTLLTTISFALLLMIMYWVMGSDMFFAYLDKFSNGTRTFSLKDYAVFIPLVGSFTFMCIYFFSFTSVAVSFFSMGELERKPARVSTAFLFGLKKSWKIIRWSFIAATVSIIIRLLEDNERLGVKILAALGGAAWAISTFFIYPVLAFEDLPIFSSIKFSAHLLKETYGELLIPGFGFGFISFLLLLILPVSTLVLTFLGYAGFCNLAQWLHFGVPQPHIIIFIVPVFTVTLLVFAMLSTVQTIFKTAVYAYCTHRPTGIFPTELIQRTFTKK